MSTLNSLLFTARDALNAQSFGLTVTGQNVSNANTPGYTRRQAILQTRVLGGVSVGSVQVLGLKQVIDQYADRRVLEAHTQSSAAGEREGQLKSIETVLNDFGGTGLSDVLNNVFASFDTLTSQPDVSTVRVEALARLDTLASRVSNVADQLASRREELFQRAAGLVSQINTKTTEIAQLNKQISLAQGSGNDAADLIDRRNQVISDLSENIDARVVVGGDGNVVIYSSGTALVDGGSTRTLGVDLDGSGNLRFQVSPTGSSTPDTEITAFLTGGKLAGVKEARDSDLGSLMSRLDQFAYDIATNMNAQHSAGVGLDGVGGRDLFDFSGTVVGAARSLRLSADVAGSPDHLAAAGNIAELPGGSSNALLLSGLRSVRFANGGTQTATEAYSDMIGDMGTRIASSTTNVQMRDALLSQAQAQRESTSGVSLDEEMVNITRYQKAYQAASKVLNIADEMYQTLLNSVAR
jgi:flagellar hook-associated protein 1 FlgK